MLAFRRSCDAPALTVLAVPIVALAVIVSPVRAQVLPVTTSSEEAREHFEAGRDYAFHYQDAETLEHLDAAIAADSTFVLAYLHRGGYTNRAERRRYFDRAEAHADGVTEGERRMIDAFNAFLWDDDIDRAIRVLGELSAEYPDDPYLPSYIGLRYYRNLRDYEAAAHQFERAIERDPDFSPAYKWRGYVALDQQDYATAEEYFQEYRNRVPDLWMPYFAFGDLYRHQDLPEEAEAEYARALERDSSAEVLTTLVYLYVEAGRYEDAGRLLRTVADSHLTR